MIKKIICCDKCKIELSSFVNPDTYYTPPLEGCFIYHDRGDMTVICKDCILEIVKEYIRKKI